MCPWLTDRSPRWAMVLLAAAQGCEFHAPLRSSGALEAVRATLRSRVPALAEDRYMHPDLAAAASLVGSGEIAAAAGLDLPGLTEETP